MVKESELDIVWDNGGDVTKVGSRQAISIRIGGIFFDLPVRQFQAILKPACIKCPKEHHESCLLFGDPIDREAYCEQNESVEIYRQAGDAPQVGKLWEDYQKAHAPKPVEIAPEPVVEPVKGSFLDKVKSFIG